MLRSLYLREMRSGLTKPEYWVYFLLTGAVTFLIVQVVTVGLPGVRIQLVGEEFFLNSPDNLDRLASLMGWLTIFMTANIFGAYACRDYTHEMQSLVFASGVQKAAYLIGRFLPALTLSTIVTSGYVVGFLAARSMPYIDPSYFQTDTPLNYLGPILIKTLPNALILGGLFFALNLVFRHQLINWVAIILLYLVTAAALRIQDPDLQSIAFLMDPLGLDVSLAGRGISRAGYEADVYLIANRLLWMALACAAALLSAWRFRLSEEQRSFRLLRSKQNVASIIETPSRSAPAQGLEPALIEVNSKGSRQAAGMWFGSLWFELRSILFNRFFLLICAGGALYLFWVSRFVGQSFETNTLPVTYAVTGLYSGAFYLFFFVIIALFSGDLIWRDRDNKIDGITGAYLPSNMSAYSSKFSALVLILLLISCLMIAGGVALQLSKGFTDHNFSLYVKRLLGLNMLDFTLLAGLAFFIHTIAPNRYIGYAILAGYYAFDTFAAAPLLQHNLLIYSSAPRVVYSDLNGFGPNVWPYLTFKLFWFLIFALLVRASLLLWKRSAADARPPLKTLRNGLLTRPRLSGVMAALPLLCGGFIFYNTNILNDFQTPAAAEEMQVAYEKLYGASRGEPVPSVTTIALKLDLYPEDQAARGSAILGVKNTTDQPITDLHLEYDAKTLSGLVFGRTARLIESDNRRRVHIWRLSTPLRPNETLSLSFEIEDVPSGFSNTGRTLGLIDNGTFYTPPLPGFGYNSDRELRDNRRRRSFGLPEKPTFIARDAEEAGELSFLGLTESFITLEIEISTPEDQRAFAPGDLVEEWSANNRRHFRYASRKKVLNFMTILSGRYRSSKHVWEAKAGDHQPVEISVHHDVKHQVNVPRMLEAADYSLSAMTEAFGPYPHNQLRIIEFPRYRTFAQSFAANIPFSEAIGFIADVGDLDAPGTSFNERRIDYPFFVTAHEIAHQWWAHQLVAANAEGGIFLVEALSQYSALRIYEARYGKDGVRKLLRFYANSYGVARSGSQGSAMERPLLRVRPDQSYVYYDKAIGALYGVSERVGRERFEAALKAFLDEFAYRNDYYPTTLDFLDVLRAGLDDADWAYIEDLLQRVTLIDYNVSNASYERTPDFTYQVTAEIDLEKLYVDDDGNELAADTPIWVDVGFYNGRGEEVGLRPVLLEPGQTTLAMVLERKPATLIIDPYYKLAERDVIKASTPLQRKAEGDA